MPKTKPCVITFYKDNEPACNITTGDLTTTEILDVLKTLMRGFSKKMVEKQNGPVGQKTRK